MRKKALVTPCSRRNFLRAWIGAPILLSPFRPARAAETGGQLELSFEASQEWIDVGGQPALLYAFNRQVPGPVIEARAGDEVRISFWNRLPETTNLHFHGLHIPSSGNADNVMLRVPPGESMEYWFTIPGSHPSGTFWYHPHVHGAAARQVSRGLAGAIVVRNDADSILEISRAPEATLVLQDFDIGRNGIPLEPSPMEQMAGREGSLVTVSGRANPELPIQRDGWLRLRIVNASSSRFYRLGLEDHPLYLVASDGGLLCAPEMRDEVLLTPGERVEVMVRGNSLPGEYRLLDLPYDRGGMAMMRMSSLERTAVPLARLRYEGQADSTWDLPAKLASIDPLPAPSVRRTFQLGQPMGMMGGAMAFTINGRRFDPNRIDQRAALNAIEQWEFVNASTMDHPMHIHTSPFQVIDAAGTPVPTWKDTVLVKARSRLAVRTALSTYPGLRMYHCHILDHEDLGMMGTLEVSRS
ncbi:MAG: multicopper oxidase family protein [Bryobacteraceae bacterium]